MEKDELNNVEMESSEKESVDEIVAEDFMEEKQTEQEIQDFLYGDKDYDGPYRAAYFECKKNNDRLEDLVKELKQKIRVKNVIIVILIIIIILLLLKGCGSDGVPWNGKTIPIDPIPSETVPKEEYDGGDIPTDIIDKPSDHVTLPMVTDIAVSSQDPTITFYNPKENKGRFELQYIITAQNGDILYDSGMHPAGEYWEVNLLDVCGKRGTHNVHISIKSRWITTQKDANGGGSDITITIM